MPPPDNEDEYNDITLPAISSPFNVPALMDVKLPNVAPCPLTLPPIPIVILSVCSAPVVTEVFAVKVSNTKIHLY